MMTEGLVRSGLSVARYLYRLRWRAHAFYKRREFRWPIYHVSRYLMNSEPRRLYRRARAKMVPSPVEARVIAELREHGISVVALGDLLPGTILSETQAWAERLVVEPAMQDRIKVIEGGVRPTDAKAGKFYIARLLGDTPVVDINDAVVTMSLSDPILRIVCGYLGMFARFTALDLWCNVRTPGPDVFSQRWHRDPEDKRIVKTFLYLRDVDEANGPFCFIRGSHNGGPFKGIYPQAVAGTNYPEDGAVERKFPPHLWRTCTGKAGTLIFCDTTGFHKGGHPTAGARLLFNGVYTTNAAAPLIAKAKQFSLSGTSGVHLGDAAQYAIRYLGVLSTPSNARTE